MAGARARALCCLSSVLLAGMLVGCDRRAELGGSSACTPDAFEALAPAVPFAERTLSPGSLADAFSLTEPGFVEMTLSPDDACVQVIEAIDGLGDTRISLDGPDPFCRTCPDRTALLVGGGLWRLPHEALGFSAPLHVRLGLRSCATLGPPDSADPPVTARIALRVPAARAADETSRGVIRVDVAFLDTMLPGGGVRSDVAARLAREVEGLLVDARLRVDVHAMCVANGPSLLRELTVSEGELGELRELVERLYESCPGFARAAEDPRITVVYTPCLRFVDSRTSARASLDGYTTHVPGGASADGVPDAIVIGGGCELPRGDDEHLPRGLARDLAHEIGHYLGLFHSVESDGETTDTLFDTSGDDLMNAQPSLAVARGLSPSQVAIMRAHPSVRWPRTGDEACAAAH